MLSCSYSKINADYTIADFNKMEVLTRLRTDIHLSKRV